MLYTDRMDNRTRVVITVTDEMHEALGRLAARRGATVAGLIRSVMGEWLEEQGEVIDWAVSWGGRRRGQSNEGGGQTGVTQGNVIEPND